VVQTEKERAFLVALASPPLTDVIIPAAGGELRARALGWLPNAERTNGGSGKSLASVSISSDCKISDTNSMI